VERVSILQSLPMIQKLQASQKSLSFLLHCHFVGRKDRTADTLSEREGSMFTGTNIAVLGIEMDVSVSESNSQPKKSDFIQKNEGGLICGGKNWGVFVY
jgi:hypothetical protein